MKSKLSHGINYKKCVAKALKYHHFTFVIQSIATCVHTKNGVKHSEVNEASSFNNFSLGTLGYCLKEVMYTNLCVFFPN